GRQHRAGQPVVTQNVTGPTQTITPHNGQITFTATLPVPTPPSARDGVPQRQLVSEAHVADIYRRDAASSAAFGRGDPYLQLRHHRPVTRAAREVTGESRGRGSLLSFLQRRAPPRSRGCRSADRHCRPGTQRTDSGANG